MAVRKHNAFLTRGLLVFLVKPSAEHLRYRFVVMIAEGTDRYIHNVEKSWQLPPTVDGGGSQSARKMGSTTSVAWRWLSTSEGGR